MRAVAPTHLRLASSFSVVGDRNTARNLITTRVGVRHCITSPNSADGPPERPRVEKGTLALVGLHEAVLYPTPPARIPAGGGQPAVSPTSVRRWSGWLGSGFPGVMIDACASHLNRVPWR